MSDPSYEAYRALAQRLDELPNGFPAAPDGEELRLLAYIFTPQEAEMAARLRFPLETPAEIADRTGGEAEATGKLLKSMARKGLIRAGRAADGLGYGLMPFVVGIYEMQLERLDAEFAARFEAYYKQAFKEVLQVEPAVHRVIPVQEAVRVDLEIQPYESVSQIIDGAQSWGVNECICRKQKTLIGEPCQHPLEVCMLFSQTPHAFDQNATVRPLTRQEAHAILHMAAEAGLVHTVSNNQHGIWYLCNCCTCSCGILRGLKELGVANVVARSAFVNTVDEERCIGCLDCLEACQFGALSYDEFAQVDEARCMGCGVCVLACPEDALALAARPAEQVKPPPSDEEAWRVSRAEARGIDLRKVM